MHVSVLEIVDGVLVEARVDDELWRRARVPLHDLPQAERAWLTKLATRAFASLAVQGTRFESDVPVEQRDLELFVEAVQGVLLLDEDAQAMNKRAKGDSVA